MGRKGGKSHLKRLPAPALWPIHRKEFKWVVRPRPGPHNMNQCLPLLLIVRDMLKLAKTRREAKIMLSEGRVKVDGQVRRDDDYPVGLMDVLEIPLLKKAYRVLPVPKKGLILHPILSDEWEYKLCQIVNKTSVKGGHLQLNLNDGRNILLKVADPQNPVEDVYETRGTLKIQLPNAEISDHLNLEEGVLAVITGGKNIGRWGEVVTIERMEGPHLPTITLKEEGGDHFKTVLNKVFTIGKGMPWISMPEVEES